MIMNWLLVETPPRVQRVALLAAEQRRTLAEQAHGCVQWLKVQGFDVVRVEQGAVGPRIIIRNSPLCKLLEGVIPAYSRLDANEQHREERYSFAYRFNCEVRWYEQIGGAA